MSVKEGDKIKVSYTGTFDDGTVFDSSEGREPLEFEVGKGMVIKGFDEAVVGMNVGDEKEFKVEADNGYGQPNPQLVQKVPKDKFPKDMELKEKGMVMLQGPDGRKVAAVIKKIEDNEVELDMNHPLAGKSLNFKIKLEEVA